ncbi:hypothetical protein J1N35_005725 [Gossypium stocksii]|uniref:Uncharacterized protein n=1 Tax=Gossypium stocksii TaxID=47602 RepID=A0A9D3WGC2_9ROSI|nr:hypothetical protein J1N35_005725 [Gossypium stocksii]
MFRSLIIDSSPFSHVHVLLGSRTFNGGRGSSNKVMAVVSAKNELVVPVPKFKRRRVSAVCDFPPGCGRVATPNSGSSKQITIDRSSQGKW